MENIAPSPSHPSVNLLRKATTIFRSSPSLGDVELYHKLIANGIEAELATSLVQLLPIAYCRVILGNSGARFSNSFRRLRADGTFDTELFASVPVWNLVLAFAQSERESGVSKEEMLAIAARSAEFEAANQLLNTGSQLKDLVFTPPLLR